MSISDKEVLDGRVMFTTVLRTDIKSKKGALHWIDDFKESSKITLCCKKTFPENTKCITFKVWLVHCFQLLAAYVFHST